MHSDVAVDASITDIPLRPKGKATYEVATDRNEDDCSDVNKQQEQEQQGLQRIERPGTDSEARCVKKAGELRYGYKRHDAVDVNGYLKAQ